MSKEDGTINLSDKKVKFWTDLINNETGDKKRALSRNLEQKVDDNVDNKFNSMLKELKLLKPYQNHETSCRELEDFKNQKDLKEKRLEYIGLKSLRIYEDSRIDPRKEYTRKAPLELVILAAYCRNDISKHAINVAKQSIIMRDKYEKNNIISRLVGQTREEVIKLEKIIKQ